jgi:hypothetical protein
VAPRKKKEKVGPSPFDYVKVILSGGEHIPLTDAYSPFRIARAVAHHEDLIGLAQMLNELRVTPEQHYAFLWHGVPKKRRGFEPWVKASPDETADDLELVAKYYQCSPEVARQYIAVAPECVGQIKAAYGGT